MSHEKSGKYACYEFERKFLLPCLPSSLCESKNYKQIEDRYFSGTNLRLRTIHSSDGEIIERKLTQKYIPAGSDLSKTVITNMYLNESELNFLNTLQGQIIKKNRYKLGHGGKTFSVDEFREPFNNLVLAEIEFNTEDEMRKFILPFGDWKDISLDSKYSGGFLANSFGIKSCEYVELIKSFWKLVSSQKWNETASLLHQDFIAVWPQSKERIIGSMNFIDVNRNYPGNHIVKVVHAFEIGNKVHTTVWIEADTGQKTFANSIFEIKDGKILSVEEYWAEPYLAPEWRRKWVEIY